MLCGCVFICILENASVGYEEHSREKREYLQIQKRGCVCNDVLIPMYQTQKEGKKEGKEGGKEGVREEEKKAKVLTANLKAFPISMEYTFPSRKKAPL